MLKINGYGDALRINGVGADPGDFFTIENYTYNDEVVASDMSRPLSNLASNDFELYTVLEKLARQLYNKNGIFTKSLQSTFDFNLTDNVKTLFFGPSLGYKTFAKVSPGIAGVGFDRTANNIFAPEEGYLVVNKPNIAEAERQLAVLFSLDPKSDVEYVKIKFSYRTGRYKMRVVKADSFGNPVVYDFLNKTTYPSSKFEDDDGSGYKMFMELFPQLYIDSNKTALLNEFYYKGNPAGLSSIVCEPTFNLNSSATYYLKINQYGDIVLDTTNFVTTDFPLFSFYVSSPNTNLASYASLVDKRKYYTDKEVYTRKIDFNTVAEVDDINWIYSDIVSDQTFMKHRIGLDGNDTIRFEYWDGTTAYPIADMFGTNLTTKLYGSTYFGSSYSNTTTITSTILSNLVFDDNDKYIKLGGSTGSVNNRNLYIQNDGTGNVDVTIDGNIYASNLTSGGMLKLKDTNTSYYLQISSNSTPDFTANRDLIIDLGNSSKNLGLYASLSIGTNTNNGAITLTSDSTTARSLTILTSGYLGIYSSIPASTYIPYFNISANKLDNTSFIYTTGTLTSTITDSASAVALTVNSQSLTTSGSKLLVLQNNGVTKFYIDKDGAYSVNTGSDNIVSSIKGSLTVSGSLTVNGNFSYNNLVNSYYVYAGPNTDSPSNGYPTFRLLVNSDIPSSLTNKTYNNLTLLANTTGFSISGGTTSKTLTLNDNLTSNTLTANGVVIVGGSNNSITSEAQLAVSRGGTGIATTTSKYALLGPLAANGAPTWRAITSADISDATNSNTANMIVKRDGSGNFIANVITASLSGNATSSSTTAISDDTTTNTTYYPVFALSASGNAVEKVSSSKLTYNPSTGLLSAIAFSGNGAALTALTANNLTGTIPSAVLGNTTFYVGTTGIALNRGSGNLALTGISSIGFPGSTSGNITLIPTAVAGTNTLTLPAVSGTLVSTGDTGTVTNTMLAGSIANSKLVNSSVTIGTTAINLGASSTTLTGLTSITSTSFVGSLTGNATSASTVVNNDDTTTNATYYPVFAITTGTAAQKTSSSKLTYNPSTGLFSSTAFSGNGAALTALTANNLTGTIPSAVLGNSTIYIGTSGIALNRGSGKLALGGISSIGFAGTTSGTITVGAPDVAGSNILILPAVSGTLVSTGDTGTVTNTMLAGSIANSKLVNSSITFGSTVVTLGNSYTTLAGLTSISSTSFTGSLTGNASTASKLTPGITLTIGNTAKTLDGSSNLTWSLSEIGSQLTDPNLTSLSGLTYSATSFVKMTAANTFSLDTNTYSLSSHTHNYAGSASVGGAANSVASSIVIKADNGSTEGTDLFTFNGSSAKVINFAAGNNVSLSKASGTITINSSYNNYYPTSFSWTGGTTAGPTGTLSGTGMSSVSFDAIPTASASSSGVITTGDQTFAGIKTFSNGAYGAVWNDIVDFVDVEENFNIEYGRVYARNKNYKVEKTNKHAQNALGIASDTFGFAVGKKDNKQIPIAIGGFVLAYVDVVYKAGTPLIATKNGMLTKAKWYTRKDKIIAQFDRPEYEKVWNETVEVNGRHWVKVRG